MRGGGHSLVSQVIRWFLLFTFESLSFNGVSADVFVDWKQNVNEVTVRLRCGDGTQKKEDVSTSFTDKSCHVSFPGERLWLRVRAGWETVNHQRTGFLQTGTCINSAPVSDGRQWSCQLQEEIEASCSRVLYKEKGGVLHVIMQKKIPFHTWPSLKVRLLMLSTNMQAVGRSCPSGNVLPTSWSVLLKLSLKVLCG